METVADFIFGGSKISADGDCSHEIKKTVLFIFKLQKYNFTKFIQNLTYCNIIRQKSQ